VGGGGGGGDGHGGGVSGGGKSAVGKRAKLNWECTAEHQAEVRAGQCAYSQRREHREQRGKRMRACLVVCVCVHAINRGESRAVDWTESRE
jgi:hypothetical protein